MSAWKWLDRERALLETIGKIGIGNCARVACHRFLERGRAYELLLPIELFNIDPGGLGAPVAHHMPPAGFEADWKEPLVTEALRIARGLLTYFSGKEFSVGSPPRWLYDPSTRMCVQRESRHWSRMREFALASGDIKYIWEPSRFQWAPILARAYRVSGDAAFYETFRAWFLDWCEKNPVNCGPNWRCAQECSIRAANFLLAIDLFGLRNAWGAAIERFCTAHGRRIEATVGYGMAQDNNHATSEALGLITCGNGLMSGHASLGAQWLGRGQCLLERAIVRLVEEDGSFSQRSTNYHRVFLDSVSLAIYFLKQRGVSGLNADAMSKIRAAWNWLYQLVDRESGCVPNFGANDGASVTRLCASVHADYRPTLSTLAAQVWGLRCFAPGRHDEHRFWLNEQASDFSAPEQRSVLFRSGGYAVLRRSPWMLFVHAPRFKFRPSQADVLHLDCLYRGRFVFLDSGTFSYYDTSVDLSKTSAHNTIQFDGLDQMPRLGRFLFGDWLDVTQEMWEGDGILCWRGRYVSKRACMHERQLEISELQVRVRDVFGGACHNALLRWHLGPGDWIIKNGVVTGGGISISLKGDVHSLDLKPVWRSPTYGHREEGKVVEVALTPGSGSVETIIEARE